ncbi:MAG: uridine kinase [Polyangiaceae bacterium]|nr:uridine kinase [Polyangiaceae bacterium]
MAPLIIGIAGGSGSGKTTVAERVRSTLAGSASVGPGGTANVVTLEHDSYYRDRPELTYDERCQLNFDHPDSLETELLVAHIRALRQGEPASVPSYDFKTHRRAEERRQVAPARVIIVEGILVFADETLRKELDVRIYVDTDADIRAFRRIRRDLTQRGRSFDSIREQYYRTVRPMHLQFVEPSKRYAHVILPEGGENTIGIDLVVGLIEKQASALSTTAR